MNKILSFENDLGFYAKDVETFYKFLVSRVYPEGIPEREKYFRKTPAWNGEEIIMEIPQYLVDLGLCGCALEAEAGKISSRMLQEIEKSLSCAEDKPEPTSETVCRTIEVFLSRKEGDLLKRIFWQESIKLFYSREKGEIHENFDICRKDGRLFLVVTEEKEMPIENPFHLRDWRRN